MLPWNVHVGSISHSGKIRLNHVKFELVVLVHVTLDLQAGFCLFVFFSHDKFTLAVSSGCPCSCERRLLTDRSLYITLSRAIRDSQKPRTLRLLALSMSLPRE